MKLAKTVSLCTPYSIDTSVWKKLKRSAFTLAEVLITLTVIGVIAAMTIPTLMTEYRKQTYVTGLKKAYSQLSNAVKMIPLTENCSAGDYECAGWLDGWGKATNIDGQDFKNDPNEKRVYLLAKQFKQSAYNTSEQLYKNSSSGFASVVQAKYLTSGYKFGYYPRITLADGMTIGTQYYPHFNTNSSFGVDVNGPKGPNTIGRDIFCFYIAPENKNGIAAGTVMPAGSKVAADYWEWNEYWKTSTYNDDCYLTSKVLDEGKMNY